tara:strand:+ start:1835 stop:2296 length:462 start_codon:yes stop_codon:yes gene_type:complete
LIDGITNPILFNKEQSEDHRGSLEYYNSVSLEKFKRFYIVENPNIGTVRAWHGHKIEGKLFRVLRGQFVLCAVLIDNWEKPTKELEVEQFTIDENSGVVYIPPGYANGLINTAPDSKIMTLSTLIYTDAINDDFRYSSTHWDPWQEYSPQIYE